MLGLCKCVLTARRERMYVAYGAALRACGSERLPNKKNKNNAGPVQVIPNLLVVRRLQPPVVPRVFLTP